ncbi:MAG: hypothetical protein JWL98_2231 [Xanthomonadaceae bacterium]|nr:hypothetical protein [Xanthomonadaceae bacterium]
MSRVAPRVYTQPADIDRLETFATQLPESLRARIVLNDGTSLEGIVEATPGMQVFFDPSGREGINALLRLDVISQDDPAHPGIHTIWLDEIADVIRLPNPSPPEPTTRVAPPDPNAPTPDRQARPAPGPVPNRRA